MEFPALSTGRLSLRAVTDDDTGFFHAMMANPAVTRFSNWADAPSLDDARKSVRWMVGLFAGGNGCAWIIADRQSGEPMGAIRYNYIERGWKCGGIGYELHPNAWGRGVMTEALRTVVEFGHRNMGLNRLEAWTLPGNRASDRVLEKVGFRFEGVARQRAWFKGAFHDFRWFARIADDPLAPDSTLAG